MPPSPAMRCSPGRETRANNHKRGHSFEGGLFFKERDEDLALFSEMQTRERETFLLQSSDDLEATFSSKLRHFSDIKLGISIPVRGESSDLLNVDGDKNDYDWLLTPPETPLFPSLDDEPLQQNSTRRGRPRSQPISISRSSTMEKSYRSSRGSASPNRLSPSPRSGSSTIQSRGRPSSTRQSSPSPSLRHATPTQRPSTPPTKSSPPVARSSTPTPTPRRLSTGGSVTSSGIRGISPAKTATRGNSASPKIRAWQTNIPGFSTDQPPNLRTSLADRPASYVRGSSPAATGNGRRQSMSPTPSRSVGSSHSHDRDPFSCQSRGSVVSSGDDDAESILSIHVGSLDRPSSRRGFSNNKAPVLSKKSPKTASPSSAPKRSFDSSVRQSDHRKSPQNMFRPLLSSVPSTTFYAGKASPAQRSLISRNSSVTTSSNASSDQGPPLDAETDRSHNNVATEFEKVPFVDVPEEVFSFDKMDDMVDEAVVHDIYDGIAEPGDSHQSGIVTEVAAQNSETSLVNDDFSEVDSLENTLVCSRCGCRYRATVEEERDTELCSDCYINEKLLSVTTLEETPPVGNTSQVPCTDISEGKLSDIFSPHVTDGSEPNYSPETNIVEVKTSHVEEQSHDYLQENSLTKPDPEEGVDCLAKQTEESPPLVLTRNLSNVDSGAQKLHQNLKVDISEGMGITVLLKRTSSLKGHVVQGKTFSATSMPYDDLSYSKDSASSMRSSVGHGTFSTSSSVDFGSRQSDGRVQRQLSGKKLSDTEYYRTGEKTARPPSTGSSVSGVTSLTNQAASLSRSTNEDSTPIPFDIMVCDDVAHGEDGCDSKDVDVEIAVELTSNSELNGGERRKESSNKTEVEESDTVREFFSEEERESGNANKNSTVSVSEIEAEESHRECVVGSSSDDASPPSKSKADESAEEALPSDKNVVASTPDSEENANDNLEQETTIVVESQKGRRTKSLTLEEATDTILFCRSIVHDLAYQAATIASEKESSLDPFEGSHPTVTILGKSNHDRRDPPHGWTINNRPSKPQKTKKKRSSEEETDAKALSYKAENDENAIEPMHRSNVRSSAAASPRKVDTLKPPKLESKCNCTIM